MPTSIRRYVPFWLSLAVGIALWEIAGRSTSAAFMVPFSATLVRLWELIVAGEFLGQLAESAKLFFTGFVLALAVEPDVVIHTCPGPCVASTRGGA